MPYFGFRFLDDVGNRGQIAFLPQLNPGASARENASALQFWRALVDSERVELTGSLFPSEAMQIQPGRLATSEKARLQLGFLAMQYQAVVWLEERLGVERPVHAPPFSAEEMENLETALAVLHDGRIDLTFVEWQAEVPAQHARAEAQRLRNHPLVVFPVTRTIFGTEVSLGRAVGPLPDVHVIKVPKFTGPNPTVILRILADREEAVSCRLLGPNEPPPPDAIVS